MRPPLAGLHFAVNTSIATGELRFGVFGGGLFFFAKPVSRRFGRLGLWDAESAVEDFERVVGFDDGGRCDGLDVDCHMIALFLV